MQLNTSTPADDMDFAALLEASFVDEPERGDLVTGTILAVDNQGLIVDVGAMKRDGIVPRRDIERMGLETSAFHVGNEIEVIVLRPEDDDGNLILRQTKTACHDPSWRTICESVFKKVSGGKAEQVRFDRKIDFAKRLGNDDLGAAFIVRKELISEMGERFSRIDRSLLRPAVPSLRRGKIKKLSYEPAGTIDGVDNLAQRALSDI